MFRKRRQPTPNFRLPPPYQPITGEQAQLAVPGVHPHCVMMQVAAADIYDDFVICRGYDTRTRKYCDYDADDLEEHMDSEWSWTIVVARLPHHRWHTQHLHPHIEKRRTIYKLKMYAIATSKN